MNFEMILDVQYFSQILDVATGRIVREFATHTYQVQGLEWTSLNSILSFGYQNLSGKLFIFCWKRYLFNDTIIYIRSGNRKIF